MKKRKMAKIFEELEHVMAITPIPFHWTDLNVAIVGVNKLNLDAIGGAGFEQIVGKTPAEFLDKEVGESIVSHCLEVIKAKKTMSHEETVIDMKTGGVRYFNTIRGPIFDEDNNIVGVIGTSIEITKEKEAEQLRIENHVYKTVAEEQEKFRKRADQLAHDINSPLSSLKMLAEQCTDIPENYRLILRKANDRIQDIANDLLHDYKIKKTNIDVANNYPQPTLVSAILFEILSEKRSQYAKISVMFNHKFTAAGDFAFIEINRVAFARCISNIINNSVDALKDKDGGQVTLRLEVIDAMVKITVQDNGKGMSQTVMNKILNNISVTEGKENGHGIGFTQIRDTITEGSGKLDIESQIGIGTSIILTFPRIESPDWIVDKIMLGSKDIVIILDDDHSIHDAWDARFSQVLEDYPGIRVEHFTHGQQALNFIGDLIDIDRHKIFLLTDYELLKQELNGLQIIEQSQLIRSILVTSHYLNKDLRAEAAKINTKILPKQLASVVEITVENSGYTGEFTDNVLDNKILDGVNIALKVNATKTTDERKVDLVLLDDDKVFAETIIQMMFKHMKVDAYFDPAELLDNFLKYPKDTKFVLDKNCGAINGITVAKILHTNGYDNLYILSGMSFENITDDVSYATPILKTDLESIRRNLVI